MDSDSATWHSFLAERRLDDGLCDPGLVTVRMPGGELSVDVRQDWSIRLQGPVEEVYAGAFSRDLMAALEMS